MATSSGGPSTTENTYPTTMEEEDSTSPTRKQETISMDQNLSSASHSSTGKRETAAESIIDEHESSVGGTNEESESAYLNDNKPLEAVPCLGDDKSDDSMNSLPDELMPMLFSMRSRGSKQAAKSFHFSPVVGDEQAVEPCKDVKNDDDGEEDYDPGTVEQTNDDKEDDDFCSHIDNLAESFKADIQAQHQAIDQMLSQEETLGETADLTTSLRPNNESAPEGKDDPSEKEAPVSHPLQPSDESISADQNPTDQDESYEQHCQLVKQLKLHIQQMEHQMEVEKQHLCEQAKRELAEMQCHYQAELDRMAQENEVAVVVASRLAVQVTETSRKKIAALQMQIERMRSEHTTNVSKAVEQAVQQAKDKAQARMEHRLSEQAEKAKQERMEALAVLQEQYDDVETELLETLEEVDRLEEERDEIISSSKAEKQELLAQFEAQAKAKQDEIESKLAALEREQESKEKSLQEKEVQMTLKEKRLDHQKQEFLARWEKYQAEYSTMQQAIDASVQENKMVLVNIEDEGVAQQVDIFKSCCRYFQAKAELDDKRHGDERNAAIAEIQSQFQYERDEMIAEKVALFRSLLHFFEQEKESALHLQRNELILETAGAKRSLTGTQPTVAEKDPLTCMEACDSSHLSVRGTKEVESGISKGDGASDSFKQAKCKAPPSCVLADTTNSAANKDVEDQKAAETTDKNKKAEPNEENGRIANTASNLTISVETSNVRAEAAKSFIQSPTSAFESFRSPKSVKLNRLGDMQKDSEASKLSLHAPSSRSEKTGNKKGNVCSPGPDSCVSKSSGTVDPSKDFSESPRIKKSALFSPVTDSSASESSEIKAPRTDSSKPFWNTSTSRSVSSNDGSEAGRIRRKMKAPLPSFSRTGGTEKKASFKKSTKDSLRSAAASASSGHRSKVTKLSNATKTNPSFSARQAIQTSSRSKLPSASSGDRPSFLSETKSSSRRKPTVSNKALPSKGAALKAKTGIPKPKSLLPKYGAARSKIGSHGTSETSGKSMASRGVTQKPTAPLRTKEVPVVRRNLQQTQRKSSSLLTGGKSGPSSISKQIKRKEPLVQTMSAARSALRATSKPSLKNESPNSLPKEARGSQKSKKKTSPKVLIKNVLETFSTERKQSGAKSPVTPPIVPSEIIDETPSDDVEEKFQALFSDWSTAKKASGKKTATPSASDLPASLEFNWPSTIRGKKKENFAKKISDSSSKKRKRQDVDAPRNAGVSETFTISSSSSSAGVSTVEEITPWHDPTTPFAPRDFMQAVSSPEELLVSPTNSSTSQLESLKDQSARKIQAAFRGTRARKEFQSLVKAVVTIQAFCRSATIGRDFQRKAAAAAKIQASIRGFQDRMKLSALVTAATLAQRLWRGKQCRVIFTAFHKSTIVLQAAFRGTLARRTAKMNRMELAVIPIQGFWRGAKKRHHYLKLLRSVLLLQKTARGLSAKNYVQKLREACNAASVIQCTCRAFLGRRAFISLSYAVISIQKVARGHVARCHAKQLMKEHKSAVCIQTCWRGGCVHSEYLTSRKGVISFQAILRGHAVRVRTQKFLCETQAAIRIQSLVRGFITRAGRTSLEVFIKAAICVQRRWRVGKSQREFYAVRSSIILIQSLVRREISRRQANDLLACTNAAKLIQKNWRGSSSRSEFRVAQHSAILIQASLRGYLACLESKKLVAHYNKAAKDIQRYWRGCAKQIRNKALCSYIISIQAAVRGHLARCHTEKLSAWLQASVCIQRYWRGASRRSEYVLVSRSTILIQSLFRASFARRKTQKLREDGIRINKVATDIQRCWRGTSQRVAYKVARGSIILIQAGIRGHFARRKVAQLSALVEAIVCVQRYWRGAQRRSEYVFVSRSIIRIQAIVRATLTRKNVEKLRTDAEAATCIQCHWRGFSMRSEYYNICHSAIVLQTTLRGYKARSNFKKRMALRTKETQPQNMQRQTKSKWGGRDQVQSTAKDEFIEVKSPPVEPPAKRPRRQPLGNISGAAPIFSPPKTRRGTVIRKTNDEENGKNRVLRNDEKQNSSRNLTPLKTRRGTVVTKEVQRDDSTTTSMQIDGNRRTAEKMKVVELRDELTGYGVEMKILRKMRKAELIRMLLIERQKASV